MMPTDGTVSGDKLILTTRPRTGRCAAFAKCEVTITGDRMSGTIDTDKGRIEFRQAQTVLSLSHQCFALDLCFRVRRA